MQCCYVRSHRKESDAVCLSLVTLTTAAAKIGQNFTWQKRTQLFWEWDTPNHAPEGPPLQQRRLVRTSLGKSVRSFSGSGTHRTTPLRARKALVHMRLCLLLTTPCYRNMRDLHLVYYCSCTIRGNAKYRMLMAAK